MLDELTWRIEPLAVFKRSRSIFLMTFLSVILYQNGQKVYMQLYYAGIKPGTDGIRHTCKSAEESWPALGPGWSGQWYKDLWNSVALFPVDDAPLAFFSPSSD
jgi:hypothetical protein